MSKVIKMSVNLSAEVVGAIRRLAKKRGNTMTEVIRQAVGTEKFLDDIKEQGGHVLIEDKRGHVRELVFR